MAVKPRNPRLSKPLVVIAIICAVIVVGFIGWNIYKYKFIKGKIKSTVYEKSNGLYTIRYDKMDLDEVAGYLYVTNLQIIPDTAKFRQLVKDKINPPLVLSLMVPELKISGVKTPLAMLGKKVNGRRLEVNNATVNFYYAKGHPDTSAKADKKEMYQQLLGDLKEIQVDTVDISNITLAFTDIHTERKTIEASAISLHLKDVLIDSLHSNDSSRFFFSKKVEVDGDKGILKNKEGTYFYHFDKFSFNNEGGLFNIKSMRITPQLSEEKFAAFSKFQNDRFNIALENISLKNINLGRLMQSDIIADSLSIRQADFKIYRDRNYPEDGKSRLGQFPQQLLMKMPVTVAVKKLVIKDAFIEYKEKNPKSDFNGKVQFTHANAVISNLTNDPEVLKRNNTCVVDFNARFLDMATSHVTLRLLLGDPNGKFMYNGSVEGFDATQLNPLIQPMGLAQIEKGKVNKLNFSMVGQSLRSDGKVTLLYEDLKLSLLKKDSADNTLKKKKLVSFIANIVVKNSNPSGKKPARVADVHYQRDVHRSFFNLMWKSVYTGVKQTAGM